MAKGTISVKIDNILNGKSSTYYLYGKGQFKNSTAIDPDFPMVPSSATLRRQSGFITPTQYVVASGANINDAPMWILTNPKDGLIYSYLASGRLISYTSTFGSETNIGTPTSGVGNGAAYYNNYIYLATPTDISRYGPLSGTPAIANTFWSSTLSKTALVNTTYPTFQESYPNHVLHAHTDGKLYIADFDSTSTTDTTRGKGLIHYIKTKYGTSGTAHEGAVDDGSLYNALDLPLGYMPMAIESYGNDLVVAAIQSSDATLRQGNSALFFWDTFADTFYRQVPIADPMVTALKNVNGSLYVFSGNQNNGVNVGVYDGGFGIQQLEFLEQGYSPFAGAVDFYGNRVAWGVKDGVVSLGYKNPNLPRNAFHHIMKTTSVGSNPAVTSMRYLQHASGVVPRVVVGWRDGSTQGIDQFSSDATLVSVFESEIFNIGQTFRIRKIKIPLSEAVAANMSIVPRIIVDDDLTTYALTTINNTNYASSEQNIVFLSTQLDAIQAGGLIGKHNFYLRLTWGGTVALAIAPPIEIEVDLLNATNE